MKLQSSEDESSDFSQETEEVHEGNGYRLIDLEGLSSRCSRMYTNARIFNTYVLLCMQVLPC